MMSEVLVKLAARDPWSFTVYDALKRKFGIEEIDGVERLRSWRLDFTPGSEEEVPGLTAKILDGTALLANPNRDIWVVRGSRGLEVPDGFLGGVADAACGFAVRVTDREDLVGQSMQAILRRRLGLSQVDAVSYSLVWILWFAPSEDDLLGLAEDVAVARSWRKGLLANPHCQEVAVFRIEDYLNMGAGRS